MNIVRINFTSWEDKQYANMLVPETDLNNCLQMILDNISPTTKTTIVIEPVGVMVDYFIADKYKKKD